MEVQGKWCTTKLPDSGVAKAKRDGGIGGDGAGFGDGFGVGFWPEHPGALGLRKYESML